MKHVLKFRNYYFIYLLCSSLMLITSCNTEALEEAEETNNRQIIKSAKALEGQVTLLWNGNPSTLEKSFIDAVNQAGNWGVVNIPDRLYKTDRAIHLPNNVVGVTIQGSNRNNVVIQVTKKIISAGIINNSSDWTVFKNITVDGLGLFPGAGIAVNGKSHVRASDCAFLNTGTGFGSTNGSGLPMDYLVAENCKFVNCNVGIGFNRFFSKSKVRKIGKITVKNCQFLGKQEVGFIIDGGNDGIDGNFGTRNHPAAQEATNTLVDMDYSEISNCYFQKAKFFNIGLAKTKNVKIHNNHFEGTTGESGYTSAIQLEHETNTISIDGNTITNYAKGDNHAFITLTTFTDYGNVSKHENGCRNISITNNTFQGFCERGIVGVEVETCVIQNNTFKYPKPTGAYDISFLKTDRGNKNIIVTGNKNAPSNRTNILAFK